MPDGITKKNHIVLLHVLHAAGYGGPGGRIRLLLVGTSAGIIRQIVLRIGDFRHNFITVCADCVDDPLCYLLRCAGAGEPGDQNIAAGGGAVSIFLAALVCRRAGFFFCV